LCACGEDDLGFDRLEIFGEADFEENFPEERKKEQEDCYLEADFLVRIFWRISCFSCLRVNELLVMIAMRSRRRSMILMIENEAKVHSCSRMNWLSLNFCLKLLHCLVLNCFCIQVLHWSGNGFDYFNLGEVNCTEERKIEKLVILIQILVRILS
jgi:hypothetical protein